MATKFIQSLNKRYGTLNKTQLAQKMLSKGTDAGKAIVNILGATGIAGFKFHIPETEMVKLENDITDHYVETGTPVQDNIVQKPITITLSGLVGDYFYSNNIIEDILAKIIPTIVLVQDFIPKFSNYAQKVKERRLATLSAKTLFGDDSELTAKELITTSFNAIDLFKLFQDMYKLKSAQTRAFLFFEALWKQRALFTVETTWKRYDNMAIQSIQAKRDRNADITDFSITFKQITFTTSKYETFEEYYNRISQQKAKVVNKGTEIGKNVNL